MTVQGLRPQFHGPVYKPSAVSIREDDGLFHYGIAVGRKGTELLINFQCGNNGIVPVPINKIYHLARAAAFTMPSRQDVQLRHVPVQVLFRSAAEERWKWYPGLLVNVVRLHNHNHGLVRVLLSSRTTAMTFIPDRQIRTPVSETELVQLSVRNVQDVPIEPHHPLTSDPKINQFLPGPLMGEILDCLDTVAQWKVRRVCTLWRDIVTISCASRHVRVHGPSSDHLYEFLCTVLNDRTNFLTLTNPAFENTDSNPHLGVIIRDIVEGCGYSRLDTVVLTGIIFQLDSCDILFLSEEVRKLLVSFARMSKCVLLYNAVFSGGFYGPFPNQNGERRLLTITIKRARIGMSLGASADQVWSQFDQNERDRLAENVTAHLKQHNPECACIGRILWVLQYIQATDPDGIPEYFLKRQRWTAENLVTLDPGKLTVFALLAVHACL